MAYGDKTREAARGAKDRVLSGEAARTRLVTSVGGAASRPFVEYRPDPDDGVINQDVRNMAPELFNPFEQNRKLNERIAPQPEQKPLVTRLPTFEEQVASVNRFEPVKTQRQKNIERSRELPIVGPILKGLDAFSESKPAQKFSDIALEMYTPGSVGAPLASAYQGIQRGIAKVAPKLVGNLAYKSGLGQVAAREALTETILGAPLTAGNVLARNPGVSGEDFATEVAIGTAAGGVFGAAGPFIGRGLQRLFQRNNIPEEEAAEILALPLGREDAIRQSRRLEPNETPIQGTTTFQLPESQAYNDLQNVRQGQTMELPAPRNLERMQRAQGTVLPRGDEPILMTGEAAEPLALPAGQTLPPTTARRGENVYRQQFEQLMSEAQRRQDQGLFQPGRELEELESLWSQMAGPDSPDLDSLLKLAYPPKRPIQSDMIGRARATQAARDVADAPLPVRRQSERFPSQVAEDAAVTQERLSFTRKAQQQPSVEPVAQEPSYTPEQQAQSRRVQQGYAEQAAKEAQLRREIQGQQYAPAQDPQSSPTRADSAIVPKQEILPADTKPKRPRKELSKAEVIIEKADEQIAKTPKKAPLGRPNVDDVTRVSGNTLTNLDDIDETRLTTRLRAEKKIPKELADILEKRVVKAPRTSRELDEKRAADLIKARGADELYSDIVNSKQKLDVTEGTAARLLAEYYGKQGDYNKVYDLLAKTSVEGREQGQFIQSLSRWNLMSSEGVLKAAERQLNRRQAKGATAQTLSDAEKQQFGDLGNKLSDLQNLEQEAKELSDLVTSKGKGELTDADLTRLTQFGDKVKAAQEIYKQLKKTVSAEDAKTVKEVGSIPPRYRKRDQVKDYLNAIANEAQQELARRRNIGFAVKVGEPTVVLYAKIGAAKIADGLVRMADWGEEMVKLGLNQADVVKTYIASSNRFRKENGMPANKELEKIISQAIKNRGLDEETANSFRAAVSEIGFAADDAKLELTRDLQRSLRMLGDTTGGEYIKAYLNSSMLLNLQTFGRNLGGVVQQLTIDKINKAYAAPIDWAISKFTGERTVKFLRTDQYNMWKSFVGGLQEGYSGITKSGNLSSGDLYPATFKGKANPFAYLEKATGATLESLDRVAYDTVEGEVLSTYAFYEGKQRGLSNSQIKDQLPQLIEEMRERVGKIAEEEGVRATYQDDTILSKLATSIRKGLNTPTDALGRYMRANGLPAWMSPEGFGLGDIVLFFAKTPANLIVRGLEYSPLGILKSGKIALEGFRKDGSFDQRQFSLSLGRAISGSLGFTALGAAMYNMGLLTGSSSKDADVRSLEEAAGRGAFKANASGIWRFLQSFDKEQAKPREGDTYVDYAWLQPVAISLGMGVSAAMAVENAEKKAEEMGEDAQFSLTQIAGNAILGSFQTILENPMLQGVQKVTDAAGDLAKGQGLDKTADIFTGVPAMFVPSLSGQVRRSLDNQMRETTDKTSILKTSLNQVKNKIPGLSESLPQSYDVLGQEREYVRGGEANTANQWLQQVLVPVKNSKFKPSDDAKLVLDLIEQTGSDTVIPRQQRRYVNITDPVTGKDKKVDLTNEQFADLQQRVGSLTTQVMREAAPALLEDETVTGAAKAEAVGKLLTKVGKKVRDEFKSELITNVGGTR